MVVVAGPAGSTLTPEQEESLIVKIRKLLALARSKAHAAHAVNGRDVSADELEAAATEAAAAMEKAQKLLHQYNISLDAVDMGTASAAQRADVEVGQVGMQVLNEDWRYKLLRAVAKVYMCHVIGGRNAIGRHKRNMTWVSTTAQLIGLPQNRMVTQECFTWVLQQLEGRGGLYGEAWRRKPAEVSPRDFRYGFFNGATQRICERLEEMTDMSREDVPEDSRAMVLARNVSVTRYVEQHWGRNMGSFGGQTVRADGGAHGMGYAAGNRVNFTTTKLGSGGSGPAALGAGR